MRSTNTTTTTAKEAAGSHRLRRQRRRRTAFRTTSVLHVVLLMLLALTVIISQQRVLCQETAYVLSNEEDTTTGDPPFENEGAESSDEQNSDGESAETNDTHATASQQKVWGAAAREDEAAAGSSNKIPFVAKAKPGAHGAGNTAHSSYSTTTMHQDPFSKGFHITTRVYTDVHDKKAHFDHDFMNQVVLPYWECGVTGSTTVPIPLQHVQVRHLLGGSKPGSFSVGGGEDNFGPQPQLIVALTPLEIVLNSGQSQQFQPGDVILLENVIAGGHKVLGVEKTQNMICMLLTLPNPYHHIGKDKNSLTTIFEKSFWKQNPCKTGLAMAGENGNCEDDDLYANGSRSKEASVRSNVLSRWAGPPRAVRRVGLGVIGTGLSLAIADFLGKCAPFILAVAFGGGALVVGGTYGVVKLGEYGIDELEVWHERRLLRLQGGSSGSSDDQQDYDSEDVDAEVLGLYEEEKKKLDEAAAGGGSSSSSLPPESQTDSR